MVITNHKHSPSTLTGCFHLASAQTATNRGKSGNSQVIRTTRQSSCTTEPGREPITTSSEAGGDDGLPGLALSDRGVLFRLVYRKLSHMLISQWKHVEPD